MKNFLSQPPPVITSLVNAMLGLLLVLGAYFALYVLSWDVLQIPAPPLRWLIGTSFIPLIFVAVMGAVSGLAASAVLLWGTPRSSRVLHPLSSCALTFGASMPVALLASRFYWHTQSHLGIAAAVVVFAASGGLMAFTMARAARKLGILPVFASRWILVFGGLSAGLAVSAAIHFADLGYIEFFPTAWLGLVTYFCLKPLPETPQTGL